MIDIKGIREHWLVFCGSCDAGLAMSCKCPAGDPRNVIDNLCNEVERLGSLAREAVDVLERFIARVDE